MDFLPLLHNFALLIALSLLHGLLARTLGPRGLTRALLAGCLFGASCLLTMTTPMHWVPGVVFDGRSILLGIAGLFGGPLAAAVAALAALLFRLHMGGSGTAMGVMVILSASALGVLGHFLRRRHPGLTAPLPLLGLGLLIHLVMFLLMALLPGPISGTARSQIGPVVLLGYPLVFMLMGRLFLELEQHFLTEEALRASETRNRALLEAMPDLMFLFSRDGRILDVQAPSGATLYAPPESFLGRPVAEVLPPDLAAMTQGKLAEVDASKQAVLYEYDLQLPLRGTCHFESRMVPCGPDAFLALVRDITDLQESRNLYEDLISSTMTGIYRVHATGATPDSGMPPLAYDFLSDRYCELTGIPRETHLSDPGSLTRAVHPEDQEDWILANRRALASQDRFAWEGRLLVGNEVRWLRFESRRRFLPDGRPVWTGVVLDVSDRRRAEAERQEMERRMLHVQKLESLGVLAGGMAHDFNNILMAILGHADLAAGRLPADAPAQEHLAAIDRAARRAADLSHQMLAYAGRGKFVIGPVQIGEMVQEMSHLLEASISKKARLDLRLEPKLPAIQGDATQIRQVLLNLLTNASEALQEDPGTITLSAQAVLCEAGELEALAPGAGLPGGRYVLLEVADTGCGMSAETMERIFEPFFTTKFTGRGLGMAAVLGIVQGHRGAIQVSSAPGQGSRFRLYFPASEQGERPVPSEGPAAPWRGQGTVLLVDDEPVLQELGKQMIEELGFQVLTAGDGLEALQRFRTHEGPVAAVVLDLTMPRMDGEETFRELRRLDPKLRILLSSGYAEQEVLERFAGMGLAGVIQKPYRLQDLAERLRATLESPGTREPTP